MLYKSLNELKNILDCIQTSVVDRQGAIDVKLFSHAQTADQTGYEKLLSSQTCSRGLYEKIWER